MTAKSEMMQAHEAMAAVLDVKLATLPEWKAFRAIDRALLALETEQASKPANATRQAPKPAARPDQPPSYLSLTGKVLEETGLPITTPQLLEYIGRHRDLADMEKAKINVTSSLSKAKQFQSIAWEGGRAWWWANQPVPRKESAA